MGFIHGRSRSDRPFTSCWNPFCDICFCAMIICAKVSKWFLGFACQATVHVAMTRGSNCSNERMVSFFPDSSFTKVVNQVVKKPTSEMELVDLEMYIEELLGWMLNIVDIVVLGRIDSCSSCGACGSDDMAIYHAISRPCNCISISFHPHHTQKI